MSEYITRERALEILNDIGGCGAEPGSYTAGWDEAINAAYEAIQSEPAADVAPVVHGKWIRIDDPEFICGDFECSNCSHREYEVDTDELMPGENHLLYCPFCGAKMDGTPCE